MSGKGAGTSEYTSSTATQISDSYPGTIGSQIQDTIVHAGSRDHFLSIQSTLRTPGQGVTESTSAMNQSTPSTDSRFTIDPTTFHGTVLSVPHTLIRPPMTAPNRQPAFPPGSAQRTALVQACSPRLSSLAESLGNRK